MNQKLTMAKAYKGRGTMVIENNREKFILKENAFSRINNLIRG